MERAPAKLNLALHVRGRRPDGYHALETLFAFVRDGDEVRITDADRSDFVMTGPFARELASDGDNLVLRAERAFREHVADLPPLAITLDKRLPVASGIGGGSADAAATLRALARRAGWALDDPRLAAMSEQLGSDVPACLAGRTAIGRGRGECLEFVEGASGTPVLLINPGTPVSTAAVFAGWDGIDRGPLPAGGLLEAASAGRNDLEPPAREIAPLIGDVLRRLTAARGVTLARMSGSGATCFALFSDAFQCRSAARAIGAAEPGWWRLETALS